MMVFAGSASKDLGKAVADMLGVSFGAVETSRFTNGELRVRVTEEKMNSSAVVIQSLAAPVDSNVIEFSLICDALHRGGVRDITAVVPFLGYSKQDKVFRPGEPLSVKVIAKILQIVPIKRFITFDLHNLAILGFFDTPVTNLTAVPLFIDALKAQVKDNTVVVSPDAGAIKSSTAFANALEVPVVYIDKKRDLGTGVVHIHGMSRDVAGCRVIIIDDMIVTGSTLIETSTYLKEHGASEVVIAATHHLFVPGAQEALEESPIDTMMITDTIAAPSRYQKLSVISVADMIAASLKAHQD